MKMVSKGLEKLRFIPFLCGREEAINSEFLQELPARRFSALDRPTSVYFIIDRLNF